MAATITISARDESDGLQSSHDALLEVTAVPPDALFVVPGDEIPVDMDSGFLKCATEDRCRIRPAVFSGPVLGQRCRAPLMN